MDRPYDDFQYISTLTKEFFSRRTFRAALNVIRDYEISGWEIWFQVEFARFLAEHEDQPEWQREARFEFDYRRERYSSFLKPDFIIRKKGTALDRYIALEIKQHVQIGNCLTNMVSDLSKVSRIRRSAIDLRSYWALGIFRADDDDDIEGAIENKLIEYDLPIHWGLMTHGKIGKTGFSYALMSGIAF